MSKHPKKLAKVCGILPDRQISQCSRRMHTLSTPLTPTSEPPQKSCDGALPNSVKVVWAGIMCLLAVSALRVVTAFGQSANHFPVWCTLFAAVLGAYHLYKQHQIETTRLSWAGAAAMLLFSMLVGTATLFSLTTTYLIALVGLIASGLWALRGRHFAMHFIPVFIFVSFGLVSLPDELRMGISLPMQLIATNAVLSMFPQFITLGGTSHQFVIHNVSYDIAPNCSGLNQWMAFTYAFLIWQMFRQTSRKEWLCALVAIPLITLLLNLTRLTITALLAYFSTKDIALAVHSNIEFVLFPLGLLLLSALVRRCHAEV